MTVALSWAKEEDALICLRYFKMGGLRLAPYLPGRSGRQIVRRAMRLGMRCSSRSSARQATIRLSTVNAQQLAYIAGVIDGDGTVTLNHKPANAVKIIVYNTHLGLLSWLHDVLGVGRVRLSSGHNEKIKQNKPCYRWILTSFSDCYLLAKALLPYAIIKKDKLSDVVAFFDHRYMFDVDGGGHKTAVHDKLEVVNE